MQNAKHSWADQMQSAPKKCSGGQSEKENKYRVPTQNKNHGRSKCPVEQRATTPTNFPIVSRALAKTLSLPMAWQIWYYNDWRNTKRVYEFENVADFWGAHHNALRLSLWPGHTNLGIFHKGQRPVWDDHPEGGKWIVQLKKQESERVWLEVLLLLVGGVFPGECGIIGALVNIRDAGDRLNIWTTTVEESEIFVTFIRSQKQKFPGNLLFELKSNRDACKNQSSYTSTAVAQFRTGGK